MHVSDLNARLAPHGLAALGTFAPAPDDPVPGGARSLTLIGPNGAAFWDVFSKSSEALDGAADPLDRWSTRVLTAIANDLNGTALFPFGGPPWHPFIGWAQRTGRIHTSPVGLLVHVTHGLFVSFRGALALPEPLTGLPPAARPCETCVGQPCRTACPPRALGPQGYDVPACKAHITAPQGAECRQGCLVRRACPVGQGLRPSAQSAFHMRAFLGE